MDKARENVWMDSGEEPSKESGKRREGRLIGERGKAKREQQTFWIGRKVGWHTGGCI